MAIERNGNVYPVKKIREFGMKMNAMNSYVDKYLKF
jgi:hypothetical protein